MKFGVAYVDVVIVAVVIAKKLLRKEKFHIRKNLQKEHTAIITHTCNKLLFSCMGVRLKRSPKA